MKGKIDDQLKFHTLALRHENVWDYDLEYISQKHVSQLQCINLWCNNITWKGIQHLTKCDLAKLRLIELDRNVIGNKGAKLLSKINCPALEQLNLCDNKITNEGVLHLSKSQWPQLDILLLNSNTINANGVRSINCSNWHSLRKLNLCIFNITQIVLQQLSNLTSNYCSIPTIAFNSQIQVFPISSRRKCLPSPIVQNLCPTNCQEVCLHSNTTRIAFVYSMIFVIVIISEMEREQYGRNQSKNNYAAQNWSKSPTKNMIDRRQMVKDVLQYPRNIVGYIKASFYRSGDAKKQIIGCIHGSGVLIGANVVLTCAHNLLPPKNYEIDLSNISENMKFNLAYHEYFGDEFQVLKYEIPSQYLEFKQQNQNQQAKKYDYALLFLVEKSNYHVDLPGINGVWDESQVNSYFDSKTKTGVVSTYGYPSDLNKKKVQNLRRAITNQNLIGYQFENKGCMFQTKTPQIIEYNMHAAEGQSGSPIFVHCEEGLRLIAIHKGEELIKEISYGITLWSMKQQIKIWLNDSDKNYLIPTLFSQGKQ